MEERSKRTAVGGGVADKWGNRYEGWWTVLSGVVPILRGKFDTIRVEPPDAAGEGVEFRLYGRQPEGPDEAHQCKRRRTTSWTVHALDVENVLAPLGRHLGEGVRVVFVSGTQSILCGMLDKAPLSLEEWSASLSNSERKASDELVEVWAVTEEEVHRRLGYLTVETISDRTLRTVAIEALASVVDGDPEDALLWLGDFLLDHLRVRLTARQLWDFLHSKGFPPRSGFNPAFSERARCLTERYVHGVVLTRPVDLPLLTRPEVDTVVQTLTAPGGLRVVAVTGPPGSGKSTIVAAACARLTELGVVVGPLRLDNARDARTAESLGTQESIGFGGSPARILARAAAGEQAVLVVDQLDALSVLAGRGEMVLGGVREMLEQARATKDLRVLVACRSHDFKHDRQLRQLLQRQGTFDGRDAQTSDLVEIPVGALSLDRVREALLQIGLAPDAAPARLLKLLTNAFNLSLLASIVQDAKQHDEAVNLARLHAQLDLLVEYHRSRGRRLRQALGGDVYATAVFHIARLVSNSGHVSIARTDVADMPDTVDALVYEGVLATDGEQLRFFHEAYFDYVFALQHVQAGRTAADLVRDDAQDLLRRGQVRAVLALERPQGGPTYLADLQTVLDRQLIRSHLRAAVLTWLKDQPAAHDEELRIVLEIAAHDQDPLRWQAVRALSNQPFASALGEYGLLTAAADVIGNRPSHDKHRLAGLLRRFDEQSCAYLLYESARQLPEAAAAACLPLASDPQTATRLVGALLQTVFLAGPSAGRATVKLFCTVVNTLTDHALSMWAAQADEGVDPGIPQADENVAAVNNIVGVLYNFRGTHALSTLAKQTPAHAAEAIHVWLSAAEKIAVHGGHHAFDYQARPLPYEATGLKIFENCATNAPVEFVRAILPFMLHQFELAALRQRWLPARASDAGDAGLRYDMIRGFGPTFRSLRDEVYDALCVALRLSSAQHPQLMAPFIRQLTTTDLLTGQHLAAAAFGACSPSLLDDALTWAADPRVQGLPNGTVGWAWGEVLAHVAVTGTDEQRNRVITLALEGYGDLDLDLIDSNQTRSPLPPADDEPAREARAAAEQLVALSLITRRLGDHTPPNVRERLVGLERKLGAAPDEPTLDPAAVFNLRSPVPDSPVPDLVARDFTDDEWLDTIRTYADDRANQPGNLIIGGAAEIAMQLEAATKNHPGRFARLVIQIGADANVVYVTAILRGLTSTAHALSDRDVQTALIVAETVFSWRQLRFHSPLCSLISALTDQDLPDDILTIVGIIATTSHHPPRDSAREDNADLVTVGMNTDRGLAARTLTHLLVPAATREHRVHILLPALQALLDDPDEGVRVMLPPAIVRIYLTNQDAAIHLAEQWLTQATEASLQAPELDRLAWQLRLSRPQAGTQLIRRMIQSPIADVRTTGGALAALVSLRREHFSDGDVTADSLLQRALQDTAARKGAAGLLAQLVDELPDPPGVENDSAGTVRADRQLLVELLNDDDEKVRETASHFALNLAQPLGKQAALLAATATSQAFAENPSSTLNAVAQATGDLPLEALDLCENWLSHHAASAGDIQTAAAGHAYYVVEIVLAIHAQGAVGSPERQRCLALLDRLIEAGAADADKKVDDLDVS